jgi:uncharacterized protein involved in type VI secretion and phage assembly
MTDAHYTSSPNVEINGQPLAQELMNSLVEVVVDSDLTAADSCEITILDIGQSAFDGMKYGARIKVSVPAVDSRKDLQTIFEGEIYGSEFEMDERGSYTRITAYDRSFRLRQERATKAFVDQTDSDIARTIAGNAQLRVGRIDKSSVVHEHMGQVNQTGWDFLQERAADNGYELFVKDGKLNFCNPMKPQSAAVTLTHGKDLIRFRARTSGAEQFDNIHVRGWDPKQKKEVKARERARSKATSLTADPARAIKTLKRGDRVTARPEMSTQAECAALAKSLAERTAATAVFAEGVSLGAPRLLAGTVVKIEKLGRFDGKYVLTRARHTIAPGDYRTTFVVSGSHDRTTLGLTTKQERNDFTGTYPAIVTNLKDKEKLGRVKLKFPWLDETYESGWARVAQTGAGSGEGVLWYPEVGDEVLVGFIGGDPRRPTVIGGMFNGKDKPPFADHISKNGEVEIRGMKSKSGHVVSFHDKKGEERIEINSNDSSCIIHLKAKDKQIIVESKGDVTVKAGKNAIVEAGADATVKAGKNLSLESGANTEIKAGGGLKIQAGAVVEIKGALVKLN